MSNEYNDMLGHTKLEICFWSSCLVILCQVITHGHADKHIRIHTMTLCNRHTHTAINHCVNDWYVAMPSLALTMRLLRVCLSGGTAMKDYVFYTVKSDIIVRCLIFSLQLAQFLKKFFPQLLAV